MADRFPEIASSLASIGKEFYVRGWVVGTSGNLSAVVHREPLRLAMTPSGVDKGELRAEQARAEQPDGDLEARAWYRANHLRRLPRQNCPTSADGARRVCLCASLLATAVRDCRSLFLFLFGRARAPFHRQLGA